MTRRARFRRDDWLELGFDRLVAEGGAGLTLERLCRAAGRTRGSFYHHFRDHDAFVEALMQLWKTRHTDDVIATVEASAAGDGAAHQPSRPASLHDLTAALDHRLEVALRTFASSHPVARPLLDEVDRTRVAYLARLYRDGGLGTRDAHELARLEYAAFVGAQVLWPDMDADTLPLGREVFVRAARSLRKKRTG